MTHSIIDNDKQVRDKTQNAIKNAKRQAFMEAVDWVTEQLKGHGVTGLLPNGGLVNQEAMRRYGDVSTYEEEVRQRQAIQAEREAKEKERRKWLRSGFIEGYNFAFGKSGWATADRKAREEARKRWPIEGEPPLPLTNEDKMPERKLIKPPASNYIPEEGHEVELSGDEYQKRQRGAFIHGANWAFKYARDKFGSAGLHLTSRYVSDIGQYHAEHSKIVEAAQERYLLAPIKKLRVVDYYFGLDRVYLRYDDVNKIVQAYADIGCTRVAIPPPMTIKLAETVQDLVTNPYEVSNG